MLSVCASDERLCYFFPHRLFCLSGLHSLTHDLASPFVLPALNLLNRLVRRSSIIVERVAGRGIFKALVRILEGKALPGNGLSASE